MSISFDEDVHLKRLLEKASAKDIMNPSPAVIKESADLAEAQIMFQEQKVSHLLVSNNKNILVGIVSPKYLYKTHSPRKILGDVVLSDPDVILDGDSFYSKESLDKYILKHLMYQDPPSLTPEHTLAQVILRMYHGKVSCLPIVDENKCIVGVITNQEIINFITRPLI